MKRNIIFICTLFIFAALASCQKDEESLTAAQVDFMSRSVYGVYSESEELFVFSEATHQLYYSPTKHSSRILKDDLSAYITVTFSDAISSGATVNGSVLTLGFAAGGYQNYALKVLKVEDGKAWVWYDRRNVGYIIPWEI